MSSCCCWHHLSATWGDSNSNDSDKEDDTDDEEENYQMPLLAYHRIKSSEEDMNDVRDMEDRLFFQGSTLDTRNERWD